MKLARDVENQVWALDKNQAVSFLMPLVDLASESVSTPRVVGILLATFAVLALMLAALASMRWFPSARRNARRRSESDWHWVLSHRRARDGCGTGDATSFGRTDGGFSVLTWTRPVFGWSFVRSASAGSRSVYRRGTAAERSGGTGELHAGSPGNSNRSNDCVAL